MAMHTVAETEPFLRQCAEAGVTERERFDIADFIAADPQCGDLLKGTGGVRKVRIAGRGKGKSGGYRVVHYYGGSDYPVLLLAIFSKGEKANLNDAERNALKKLTAAIDAERKKGAKA